MTDAEPSSPHDISSIEALEQDSWNCSDWIIPRTINSAESQGDVYSDDDDRESNSEEVGSDEVNEGLENIVQADDGNEEMVPSVDNEYIRSLLRSADLHILQPGQVSAAYGKSEKEVELFHLFMTKNYLGTMSKWTNEVLIGKGRKPTSNPEFFAYIGLELGMSLLKFNEISKYWSRGSFLGHDTYKDTMSRQRFQEIRSCVRFHSQSSYDAELASSDPLWFCRSLLDQFIRRSATIAVPLGVSALDENSCATKARTKAKTYSPNKPAKYAIRFYAVVGHRYCYLSSMFDNRAGNSTGIAAIDDYCRLFRTLRTPYNNVMGKDQSKDSLANTPSALWVCMMGHQTATCKQPNGGKRYFFCDNFYTRHTIGKALNAFTDGESRVIGTVKFTNVDATNRHYLSKAIELMKDASRGTWMLVRAFTKNPEYERLHNQHSSQQR